MDVGKEDSSPANRSAASVRRLACTVDERLAELFEARCEEARARASAEDSIRSSAGQGKVWSGRTSQWVERARERMAAIEAALAEKHGVSLEKTREDLEGKYGRRRR